MKQVIYGISNLLREMQYSDHIDANANINERVKALQEDVLKAGGPAITDFRTFLNYLASQFPNVKK